MSWVLENIYRKDKIFSVTISTQLQRTSQNLPHSMTQEIWMNRTQHAYILITLWAIDSVACVGDSTCSTAFRSDRDVPINPVLRLLPFPHVWQNLDWSHPRSFKRRSIVVSSAWEGCSVTAAMGEDPLFPLTLSLLSSSICVFVFEVVVFVSWIEAATEYVNRHKFFCHRYRDHMVFYRNVSLPCSF